MNIAPATAIHLSQAAHRRLLATVAAIDDATVARPSRLPGWTVGHVLTHVARNADGHTRRLDGALAGLAVPRYPGGLAQRDGDIENGSTRTAREIREDIEESVQRLEAMWARSAASGWPHADLLAGDHFPTSESPIRRLREVEMHHVDLGLGYEVTDWPNEYVEWELPRALEQLPTRLGREKDAHRLLGWLTGRSTDIDDVELPPWS